MEINYTSIMAIIALTVVGIFAVWKGFDGAFLFATISAIAGLGGYEIKQAYKNDTK